MSKYKELVYMVLDELKLISDDSTFTEDHIIFQLNKYRTMLLKQKYSDVKKQIPESNYQSIVLPLQDIVQVDSSIHYYQSTNKVPIMIPIGQARVTPIDYYIGELTLISKERMRYVGYNKYLKNIAYCSISPDYYLMFYQSPLAATPLSRVRLTAVFEDADKAALLVYGNTETNLMELDFPIEEGMIPQLIQFVVKEIAGPSWKPKDDNNNSSDDLSELASFVARNTKSGLQQQMES